ncbi:MAG: hypothetical protein ABJD97_13430 [Betaproteobacteria bacterium]
MKFLVVLLLASCALCPSAFAAGAVAPTLAPADLFKVVFPAWRPGALPHEGVPSPMGIGADAPGVKWPWLPEVIGDDPWRVKDTTLIEAVPLLVVRIDETHAALLARINAYEGGCHYGCLFNIGTYFFTQDEGGWRLTRRVDRVRTLVGDDLSNSEVRDWPGHGKVFATTLNFYAQGQGADQLLLLGLGPDRIRFSFETSIKGGSDIEGQEWHVDGTWSLDEKGVLFEFDGQWPAESGQQRSRSSRPRKTSARIELRQGVMVLVHGQLPRFAV